MTNKKENFLKELSRHGCAVLVGPMLEQKEYELIPKEGPLLLVDGGADAIQKCGFKGGRSHFTVGDGDSGLSSMDEKLPQDKDYSDLCFALSLIPKEVTTVQLYGFLGGRKDHELINFGEAHQFLLKKKTPTTVLFSEKLSVLSKGEWLISAKNLRFSLMALDHPMVTLRGNIDYEVIEPTVIEPLSSKFLSNFAHEDFQLSCTSPVFIYGEGLKIKNL